MAVRVFYAVNMQGRIVHNRMYLSESRAQDYVQSQNDYNCKEYSVRSQELEFAGKHISQVEVYRGFDYTFDGHSGGIYSVFTTSLLFPTIDLAKQSKLWEVFKNKAESDRDKHNFYENKICSKNSPFDNDWSYGDVMEGKFSMEIKRYKVDRRD